MLKDSLSVIIPALNEQAALPATVDKITGQLEESGLDWEIILVNDGSSDNTKKIMEEMSGEDRRLRFISHEKPEGIGKAYKSGVKLASKDLVTWIPADGENDLKEHIAVLASGAHKRYDILVPYVANKNVRPFNRRFFSSFFVLIIRIVFNFRIKYTNGNSIYKRKIIGEILPESSGFFFQAEMLVKAVHKKYSFMEFPIHLNARAAGRSKALKLKSFLEVAKGFIRLFYQVRLKTKKVDLSNY